MSIPIPSPEPGDPDPGTPSVPEPGLPDPPVRYPGEPIDLARCRTSRRPSRARARSRAANRAPAGDSAAPWNRAPGQWRPRCSRRWTQGRRSSGAPDSSDSPVTASIPSRRHSAGGGASGAVDHGATDESGWAGRLHGGSRPTSGSPTAEERAGRRTDRRADRRDAAAVGHHGRHVDPHRLPPRGEPRQAQGAERPAGRGVRAARLSATHGPTSTAGTWSFSAGGSRRPRGGDRCGDRARRRVRGHHVRSHCRVSCARSSREAVRGGRAGDTYFVTFLADRPTAVAAERLESLSNDFDTLVVRWPRGALADAREVDRLEAASSDSGSRSWGRTRARAAT